MTVCPRFSNTLRNGAHENLLVCKFATPMGSTKVFSCRHNGLDYVPQLEVAFGTSRSCNLITPVSFISDSGEEKRSKSIEITADYNESLRRIASVGFGSRTRGITVRLKQSGYFDFKTIPTTFNAKGASFVFYLHLVSCYVRGQGNVASGSGTPQKPSAFDSKITRAQPTPTKKGSQVQEYWPVGSVDAKAAVPVWGNQESTCLFELKYIVVSSDCLH